MHPDFVRPGRYGGCNDDDDDDEHLRPVDPLHPGSVFIVAWMRVFGPAGWSPRVLS